MMDSQHSAPSVIPIASSSNGRISGKSWKLRKTATVRSHLSEGVKTKTWDLRMEKTNKQKAVKKLQAELKAEKAAEFERKKTIATERKKAAEERQRIEEAKEKMGARRAARLRRRAGRSKTVKH